MTLQEYIYSLDKRYRLQNATEHTFRADLQQLLESLVPDIRATNEPKRQKCGAPDYILTKKDIPVGFVEAKDIGDKDLEGKKKTANKEQFDRYKASLNNLIFTDYINFHFYREGQLITKIAIGVVVQNGIESLPENFVRFENLIKNFCTHLDQTIKSPKKLAQMMAGKARLLSDIIQKSLTSDEQNQENSTLKEQMVAFKEILIHDITPQGFADVYAQTIAYGMFAARLHDTTMQNFSRQKAAELIPKSNPFLRKLFGYIAGPDIDNRIKWVVENLSEIFLATNVEEILRNHGRSTKMEDPIIHFYETFLSEYDPKLRKARGVWYTPQPVVDFIVRAVDDILKTEFDLAEGLADTSKTKITVNTQTPDKRSSTGYKQTEQEVHKVQILDPATGTGTFLAEIIKHIYKKFLGQQGIWSSYVESHLLPRLNGFELLMASYAMAHLKLDLLLRDTGFKPTSSQRFRVYLTNSLEESHPDTGTLFANWLSIEANEANRIKRDAPVMVVLGNPPYSGESVNKGQWIMDLMEDYKKEPEGRKKLKEKNPKWINDDYVKFIRYGQHFIEKNGSGVLAYINPHGFLDNPTFRGMRWHLLKTYDKIYTIDLHGNSKKKEACPDGSPDINVFDIQQGVSINLFVRTGKKKTNELGKVFHYDLYGKRDLKYDFLTKNSLKSIPFNAIPNIAPMYFMVQKNFSLQQGYNKGAKLNELFKVNNVGIVTSRDSFIIDTDKQVLFERIQNFFDLEDTEIKTKYSIKENKSWKIGEVKKTAERFKSEQIQKVSYRPFDAKFIYYDNDFIERSRTEIMQHMLNGENLGLNLEKIVGNKNQSYRDVFISKNIYDAHYLGSACYGFPLYFYPQADRNLMAGQKPRPNFNPKIIKQIEAGLGLELDWQAGVGTSFVDSKKLKFSATDLLDYIYATLHSPTYREKYKEFLKIDFPRVPYPKDPATFWQLVKLGGELRQIHLLESPKVEQYFTQYPVDGSNIVDKPTYRDKKVYINHTQYFDNVPQVAWKFYVGGYQPAQKWLKDRKQRKLEFEDILHYQKIIVALTETSRLMKQIDKIEVG
jgi:predicted helicase